MLGFGEAFPNKARRWLKIGGCNFPVTVHNPNLTVHDAPRYRLRLLPWTLTLPGATTMPLLQ